MAILGISSATKIISIGLAKDGMSLAELSVSGKSAFTEDLMVYIDEIIKQGGVSLSAISVASGPGSYNGLRGGLATAKTIAQTLSLPLIEVSTLEAIAYNLIDCDATIVSICDARKDEYNCALFTSLDKNLRRLTDDMVIKIDKLTDFLSKIQGKIYLCDSNPKGINVALIGERKLKEGKISDYLKLAPKYSVEPNIREFKR